MKEISLPSLDKAKSSLLKRMAKEGCPDAAYELGMNYMFGKGVKFSRAKTIYWWKKSSQQGHKISKVMLAVLLGKGNLTVLEILKLECIRATFTQAKC